MMVEMPHDQRNVSVPALPDRLAVIHRLQHGDESRVLLHVSGYAVQVSMGIAINRYRHRAYYDSPRTHVRGHVAPGEIGSPRSLDCDIHILCGAL